MRAMYMIRSCFAVLSKCVCTSIQRVTPVGIQISRASKAMRRDFPQVTPHLEPLSFARANANAQHVHYHCHNIYPRVSRL